MKRRWKTLRRGLLIVLALLAIFLFFSGWYYLFRENSQPAFATEQDAFNYGSIGNEQAQGVPYWIWRVLPAMFPEYLPAPGNGYASLGLFWEDGKPTPVGFSVKTVGVERVAINCAFCHQGAYRIKHRDPAVLVTAGPGTRVAPQLYLRFLANAAADAKFNTKDMLEAIDQIVELGWLERLFYRFVYIPFTKRALLQQAADYAWTYTRPDWGRGRIDPFNPVKFGILKLGLDETIGNSDMMPLWNLAAMEGIAPNGKPRALHWDGLNTSVHEVVVSGAIGDGMTYKSYPRAKRHIARIEAWLSELQAPPSPFSSELAPDNVFYIDAAAAARGEALYRQHCADCHSPAGQRFRTVIDLEEVGTDGNRAAMWTPEAMARYSAYEEDHEWGFGAFQNEEGYVAVNHDALWLRAPFLHNGSVPTLKDLLLPPHRRPKTFYRGYDVIDPRHVGFVSSGTTAKKYGELFDTRQPGNSNQGHLYGTELANRDKQDLLDYLKTL